jgi:hypothetical protein
VRASAASLEVTPIVPGHGRPTPPRGLDAIEKRIWRDVVDALPDHWLDPAGQLILRRLVAQAAIAERREARLRQLRAQGSIDEEEELDALAGLHSVTAKTVAYLLTQLRATPRSRMVSRTAGPLVEQAPTTRPWEIKARVQTPAATH